MNDDAHLALPGVVPPTGAASTILSDVIVELEFAPRETVEEAVRAAGSPGTTVAGVLVDSGAITEEQLARATAERHRIDYVDLSSFDVDPAAANLIKAPAARRYRAAPVAFAGGGLLVAMADPADALAVEDIAAMTKHEVRLAVASRPALEELLAALPLGQDGWRAAPAEPAAAAAGPAENPAPTEAADALRLHTELEQLKAQLAGAEAELQRGNHGANDFEASELRARLAVAEMELEEARTRLRDAARERDEIRAELSRVGADAEARKGELDSLRTKLTTAETGLVRVRAELDARDSELEAMRTRTESAEREVEVSLRRASEAEERAEQARRALAQMREESERERERAAMTERELRAKLGDVENAAAAAERSFQDLRLALTRGQTP